MSFQRLWVIFKARNREYFRDRAAFGWNFLFPFLIIAGFGLIFGGKELSEYKVGVFPLATQSPAGENLRIAAAFGETRYLQFVPIASLEEGLTKLNRHKIDFLVKNDPASRDYWVNDASPKGYMIERLFNDSLRASAGLPAPGRKNAIQGARIRYIDWLFPGILGMNMMFSALWGVGYVVVRYRKNGVLKRLKATPLTALEYLGAQVLSRVFLLMFSLVVVWVGCDLIFHFQVAGRYLDLLLTFLVGGLSLTAVGVLMASRGVSEEFTSGVLNFITWPMMFLSEVWFSLEGSPRWVWGLAQVFPLTHLISAVRKIMNDGADLMAVRLELAVMLAISAVCLALGARLFSWNR
ncbi:MAG: ABC transporter permease [Desulfobacteraceae bacterium]|jgi:ABC-type multidrug transport system permease subunit|nr:ABC transporter permease [Desulfobacteraceae bacterium]